MGNEFGTDMSTFNIGDYIWYIVGGIALFFVIVGYIADKSGLAKRTFSKEVKKSDNRVNELTIEEINEPVVEEFNDELISENNVGYFDENVSFVEMPNDAILVNDDISLENNDNLENDDIIGGNEPLYISEEPEEITDDLVSNDSIIDNSEIVLDSSDSDELQNDIDNVWSEDTVIDDTDSKQDVDFVYQDSNLDDDELPPIAEEVAEITEDIGVDITENSEVINNDTFTTDNVEEEWGIEAAPQNSESGDLIDVELPNLDDIDVNSEEDVWKF